MSLSHLSGADEKEACAVAERASSKLAVGALTTVNGDMPMVSDGAALVADGRTFIIQTFLGGERVGRTERESTPDVVIRLPEQYAANVRVLELEAAPLLEERDGKKGITDIRDTWHDLLTEDVICEALQQPHICEKIKQGFTQLIIEPYGLPLKKLRAARRASLLRHADKLHYHDKMGERQPLTLDRNAPLVEWDGWKEADESGALVYGPTEYTDDHAGQTKRETLENDAAGGFRVFLVEDRPELSRKGEGIPMAGRSPIETGRKVREYPLLLRQSSYEHEMILSPEGYEVYGMRCLEEKSGLVVDATTASIVDGYFPNSGDVPFAYFLPEDGRARTGGVNPRDDFPRFGPRPAVRVL